jgi:hypothetical protein
MSGEERLRFHLHPVGEAMSAGERVLNPLSKLGFNRRRAIVLY